MVAPRRARDIITAYRQAQCAQKPEHLTVRIQYVVRHTCHAHRGIVHLDAIQGCAIYQLTLLYLGFVRIRLAYLERVGVVLVHEVPNQVGLGLDM